MDDLFLEKPSRSRFKTLRRIQSFRFSTLSSNSTNLGSQKEKVEKPGLISRVSLYFKRNRFWIKKSTNSQTEEKVEPDTQTPDVPSVFNQFEHRLTLNRRANSKKFKGRLQKVKSTDSGFQEEVKQEKPFRKPTLQQIPQSPFIEQMSSDCNRVLIAGTSDSLFQLIFHPSADDVYKNFTKDYLLTYRYHMDELEFFQRFKNLFQHWQKKLQDLSDGFQQEKRNQEEKIGRMWLMEDEDPLKVLMKALEVFQDWLSQHLHLKYPLNDFNQNADILHHRQRALDLLKDVSLFLNEEIQHHSNKQIRIFYFTLKQILSKRKDELNFGNSSASLMSSVVKLKKKKTRTKAQLLSIPAEELFKQLTLIEWDLFLKVHPIDILLKSKNLLNLAPDLKELIQRFNHVSYWVATEICMCRNMKTRMKVLKRFILVADMCFQYHNYNTCLQIVAALSMTCVQRLKETWKILPKKYQILWQQLSSIFSANRNYYTYRKDVLSRLHDECQNLPSQNEPALEIEKKRHTGGIPFMGIHLSDLLFIEEAHGKDRLQNEMIYFHKMRLIATTFRQLTDLQKSTYYPFEPNHYTKLFLTNDTFILDEDKLWKASRICEPPESGCEYFGPTLPSLLSPDFVPVTPQFNQDQSNQNIVEDDFQEEQDVEELIELNQNLETHLALKQEPNFEEEDDKEEKEKFYDCLELKIPSKPPPEPVSSPISPTLFNPSQTPFQNSKGKEVRSIGCQTEIHPWLYLFSVNEWDEVKEWKEFLKYRLYGQTSFRNSYISSRS